MSNMSDHRIRRIVILGGGTAGWMTAAGLSKVLQDPEISIRLVESDAIGTVGVGEATIPVIRYFNRFLEVDEDEFLRRTHGTFKLGIVFEDWARIGDRYIHPFGPYGQAMDGINFHHHWYRFERMGPTDLTVDDFNLQALAAFTGKFQRPDPTLDRSPLKTLQYAYHFDASLYARYLRTYAEERGVARTEGKVDHVELNSETGHVERLLLESGEVVEGELFVDCSGFRARLIEEALDTGYDDWSNFLPCNSAVAGAYRHEGEPVPYTRAVAKEAGWQWHIPLQFRTGAGYVFCNAYLDDEAARESFRANRRGPAIREPYILRFTTGIRNRPWNRNVVSIGLASGFLEPLESTSIHIIQTGIARLLANFPDKHFNQSDIDYYNSRTRLEFEQIRDFLVMHYKLTERDDTPFWRHCRAMAIPHSLEERLAIFRENGRVYRHDNEVFAETNWFAVMHGQRMRPARYHPVADLVPEAELRRRMEKLASITRNCRETMPTHQQFIDRHCKATEHAHHPPQPVAG